MAQDVVDARCLGDGPSVERGLDPSFELLRGIQLLEGSARGAPAVAVRRAGLSVRVPCEARRDDDRVSRQESRSAVARSAGPSMTLMANPRFTRSDLRFSWSGNVGGVPVRCFDAEVRERADIIPRPLPWSNKVKSSSSSPSA